jgi:hypothetical protein
MKAHLQQAWISTERTISQEMSRYIIELFASVH